MGKFEVAMGNLGFYQPRVSQQAVAGGQMVVVKFSVDLLFYQCPLIGFRGFKFGQTRAAGAGSDHKECMMELYNISPKEYWELHEPITELLSSGATKLLGSCPAEEYSPVGCRVLLGGTLAPGGQPHVAWAQLSSLALTYCRGLEVGTEQRMLCWLNSSRCALREHLGGCHILEKLLKMLSQLSQASTKLRQPHRSVPLPQGSRCLSRRSLEGAISLGLGWWEEQLMLAVELEENHGPVRIAERGFMAGMSAQSRIRGRDATRAEWRGAEHARVRRGGCWGRLGKGKRLARRGTAGPGVAGVHGWRLNHFPGQPVPMLHNPFNEVKFPNTLSKPPLVQLEAISSHPITCYLGEETDPHVSTTSFQAKQPQFPQPLLIRLVLQTLHQLRCPSLHTLQHLNVSLVVRGPKLNTGFEVRPHQCRVQGHDHFPSPAGHTISDTSQDAVGFLGHLGTLLAHIQLAVNQHPQVLFCQAAFQPLFPKPVALHGVAVTQVQDLALGLVEPHTIELGPSIQPVQVPLQSLPTLKQINTPAQLGVICKLTEGALDPFVQIIDKDIK
ncbi:hypothetical protein QYF61_024830 [Mycteria americana]|uniref:Uncharacterized protein n=1 Tax=Mycteria americana TaxID=33587 RepID=A0AAN7P9W7_MYCAM|nr:hypothetical protein QYF61_024830 [Mycteria americana]